MSESDFRTAVMEQLATMRTDIKYLVKASDKNQDDIDEVKCVANHADQSVKSAHHRIDGLFASAGLLGAAAGWAANFITSIWPKNGQ